MKAKEFGVDPERLGVFGGSAGGHLSLLLGTTGDDGNPKSKDDILKQGSRVAAVVALYPPTDIRGWVTDPPAEIKKHAVLQFCLELTGSVCESFRRALCWWNYAA